MKTITDFKEIRRRIPVTDYVSYRDYLAAIFAELKVNRGSSRYSYQQFAVDLGFSFTNVIRLVIVGKRRLTPIAIERIIDAIELIDHEKRYFITLVRYGNARLPKQREKFFQELMAIKGEILPTVQQQAALEYYSEWYHPVIRELVGMRDFRSNASWIAGRLFNSVLPRQITKSLELLEQLGLIAFDAKTGRHVQVGGPVRPDRAVETMAAVRCHQKMIEIGRESLTRVDETRREIHGVTIRVSEETAEKIKAILIKACEDVVALEQDGDGGDQVYQLNLQFFPFTKLGSQGSEGGV